MKCEGCPFWGPPEDPYCWANELGKWREEYCHLTPNHQRIIDAMIRGTYHCGTCQGFYDFAIEKKHGIECKRMEGVIAPEKFWPCLRWQERKEGEDG